jgi:glutathione S-transferase
MMLKRLSSDGDAVPEALALYARRQWQRPSIQSWVSLRKGELFES